MEKRNYHDVDTVLLFVASFIYRSPGFVEKGDFTRMNVVYSKRISKLLFDKIGEVWTAGELARFWSEISKIKTVAERTFRPHRSSGLLTLRFHLLDHVGDGLERFGSLSFTDAAPAEHFNVLIKQS